MADFNKPTVDSEYTQFPTEIRAAISAALSFLDGEHTNVPLKAKRWNPSTKIFEEYNGAQWVPMATEYKLPVDYNSLKNKPLPNSAVDDESDTKFASSAAVKTAYDKATEAKEAASAKQSPATTLAGYGIGNFKVEQGQGDANGYKTDGNYYLASGQNLPENGAWHIEVVSGGATNAVRQIARKANDNKIKTRFFNGSNWSEWSKRWRAQVRKFGVSKSATFFDSSRRKKWAEMLEKQLESGKYNEIPDITLDELIDKYLKEVTVTKHGKREERIRLLRLSRTPLAAISLQEIGKAHFREW